MNKTILIFSETHLTHLPDERKLQFFLRIVGQANEVIINGDFWDYYLTSPTLFISSLAWQPLSILLKQKSAVYLYGKHDSETMCDGIENTFSSQLLHAYQLRQSGLTFHIEQGNTIAPDLDEIHTHAPNFIKVIGSLLDNFFTLIFKKHFLKRHKKINTLMIKRQLVHLSRSTLLICGHSRYAELSPCENHASSGSIRSGIGSYLTINNGKVSLFQETY